jgi:hypothetical protein
MTEVAKAAKQTDVIDRIVGLLLQLYLPATLRRRPPPRTLVLANLVKNARREDLGRDALHAVGLVEMRIALVKVLVIDLEVLVLVVALLRPLGDDVRLEVEERPGVGLAGEGGLTDEDVRDVLEDTFDDEKAFDERLLDRRTSFRLLAKRFEVSGTLAS